MLEKCTIDGGSTGKYHDRIEYVYNSIVPTFNSGANVYVPRVRKGFFKFWWDAELDLLKDASVESNRLWIAAGKPRQSPIFYKRQSCRLQYRKWLRDSQKFNTETYTNDFHDALVKKNGTAFWQTWRSKFDSKGKCTHACRWLCRY